MEQKEITASQSLFPNGKTRHEQVIVDDKFLVSRSYYANGKVMEEVCYVLTTLDGCFKIHLKERKQFLIGTFNKQLVNGIKVVFDLSKPKKTFKDKLYEFIRGKKSTA